MIKTLFFCLLAVLSLSVLGFQQQENSTETSRRQITLKRAFPAKVGSSNRTLTLSSGDIESIQDKLATGNEKEKTLDEAIDSAKSLSALGQKRTADQNRQAKQLYSAVIDHGSKNQSLTARNDLAVLYLSQGKADLALAQMNAIDFDKVPAGKKFAIRYNQARALEQDGRLAAALKTYEQSYHDKPSFFRTANSALTLLASNKVLDKYAQITTWNGRLLEQGKVQLARQHLTGFANQVQSEREAARLLPALMQLQLAGHRQPQVYQTQRRMAKMLHGTKFDRFLNELDKIYLGDLTGFLDEPRQVRNVFSMSQAYPIELAELFKRVGNDYRRRGVWDQATARYLAAWELDIENTDYPLSVMTVLKEHSAEIKNARNIRQSLIKRLFDLKGGHYWEKDYKNILRKHILLAQIFEMEKKWGNASNSHSVIFQWKYAIKAQSQLSRRPAPGLYRSLAHAYRMKGKQNKALSAEMHAAAGFIVLGKPSAAGPLIEKLNSHQRAELDGLVRSYQVAQEKEIP